jgi:hypothetical protein
VPAAFLAVALPAPALSVTAVSLSVSPEHHRGACPAVFKFTGKVVLNGEGRFTYKWERSDGAIDSAAPHTASYNGSTPTLVEETWTLGAPGAPFHPFHGWAKLHILTPTNKESNEAKFVLDCGEGNGGPNAKCDGKPDLVPLLHSPMDGWVAVKNNGPGAAGPSQLIVKCTLVGYPAPGGCPSTPSSLPAPFIGVPGGPTMFVGVNVPAIPCGATVAFPMPFWANMFLQKGTYNFTAIADSTNAVAESNEGNNVATSTLVK